MISDSERKLGIESIKYYIKKYENILDLMPDVLNVMEGYHGKTLKQCNSVNKKLENIHKYLSFDVKYNSCDIRFETLYVMSGCIESSYCDGVFQNGYFDFNICKERIEFQRNYLLLEVRNLKDSLHIISDILYDFESIKKDMDRFNSETPYLIREVFNLKWK